MNIVFDYDWVIDKSMDYQIPKFREFTWKDVSLVDFQQAFTWNVFDWELFKGVNPELYARFIYDEQSSRVYDPEVISALSQIAWIVSISICTSSDERNIKAALEKNWVKRIFDFVLWRESWKGKVEKLLQLKQNWDNWFVTDTLWDIKDWKEAWYDVVWITGGFHDRETLESWKPELIVDSIQEIYNRIGKQL